MKTNIATLFTGLAALGTLGACTTTNQLGQTQLGDVDPMYAQYRTPVAEPIALNETVTADYSKGNYQFQDESLSSKTVNPDLVAQYQNGDQRADDAQGDDDYYVEDYNRPGAYGNQPQVVNNFYGNPNRFSTFGNPAFGAGFYDPFWGSGMGFYDPFWGPGMGFGSPWAQPWGRPGFNVSLGFGWGGGFGWNRWNRFDRFGGYGGYYDPFWGPSMAYGYGGYGYGGYGGFYGRPNVIVVNNEPLANQRGRSLSRSSDYSTSRARVNGANDARRSSTSRASRATNTGGRNAYDSRDTRSAYGSRNSTAGLTRSRNEAYNTADSRGSSSSQGSRTRSNNNYTASPSRSASPNYQRSSGRSSTYSSPSRTRSSGRSYSTPSNSSRGSYGSSRSSGYSSSPSRSSGSSYGSSRSSGSYSSSPSRSSSGSSSRSSSGGSSRSRSPR